MRYTGLMARTNRHRLRALADRIMADAREFDRLVRRDPRAVTGAPEPEDIDRDGSGTSTSDTRHDAQGQRRPA